MRSRRTEEEPSSRSYTCSLCDNWHTPPMSQSEALVYPAPTKFGAETFAYHNVLVHGTNAVLKPVVEVALPNAIQPRTVRSRPPGPGK